MPRVKKSSRRIGKASRGARFSSPLRPVLERILAIHTKVVAGDHPNCRHLSSDLEVSEKTLLRDIEFMRDRLGLPIIYDRSLHGFRYTEPVSNFPSLQITEGEVVALLFAQKSLAQYRGTPFEKPLQSAIHKLISALPDSFSVGWAALAGGLEFRPAPVSPSDMAVFQVLSDSVRRRQEVGLLYHKLEDKQAVERIVHPRQLCCAEGQWYLVAHDTARSALRNFAVPRIQRVVPTGKTFAVDASFNSQEYWADSFGAFVGSGQWRVRVRFDAFTARIIQERQWHPSQKIKKCLDGEIEVMLKLSSLHEVLRWVLGWGEHVTVLEPVELGQQIRNVAGTLMKRYPRPEKPEGGRQKGFPPPKDNGT